MIEVVTPYALTASATVTAAAAVGAYRQLSSMADRVDDNEKRSLANQRRQIGEPTSPETLDEPILDRLRDLERSDP